MALAYDRTAPGDSDYGPGHEDYMTEAERVAIKRLFKPAGRQTFADEQAQRDYLRLVGEFERPPRSGLSNGQIALLVLGAIAAGTVVGLLIRKLRAAAKTPRTAPRKTKIGLDLLGVHR